MARQLDRLLPPDLVQCLRAHGVSDCGHLFELSDVQLMSICDMSYRDIRLIIADLSAKLISTSVRTAQELLSLRSLGNRYLPTGLQDLDSALGGGLAMGTIVEMCGAPGVGKSQFCLSCCASALLAPPSSSFLVNSVIYIDTELKFSAVRLREIICARSPTSDVNIEMGRINVKRISSVRQLYDCIDALQMEVITTNVALVIIDSIASLARKEGLNEADKEKFILHQVN